MLIPLPKNFYSIITERVMWSRTILDCSWEYLKNNMNGMEATHSHKLAIVLGKIELELNKYN